VATESQTIQVPPGMIAMCSPGSIRVETALCLVEAGKQLQARGIPHTIVHFPGSLVDKARNDAVRRMLGDPNCGYVIFIDGDMTFRPEQVGQLIEAAYGPKAGWADVVGGYCVLRGGAIPTIDTGTGTWESHYPGSGVKEVIRTGGAFLLVKRHVAERLPEPWFALRFPMRWLDALAEIDNFARTKFDGANPFRDLPNRPWERLVEMATADQQSTRPTVGYEIGEDSGFCDRVRAAGMRIVVDTDLEIGHIDTIVLTGATHKERMDERHREHRQVHGILI
jgi:hypothetical protein